MTKRCRTCRYLRPPQPDRDGKIRYRKTEAYLCRYEVPWPELPSSMPFASKGRLPTPGWVEITDGADCPVWAAKENAE